MRRVRFKDAPTRRAFEDQIIFIHQHGPGQVLRNNNTWHFLLRSNAVARIQPEMATTLAACSWIRESRIGRNLASALMRSRVHHGGGDRSGKPIRL